MKLLTFINFSLAILFFFSCSIGHKQERSRVALFHYGGYGDTLYSTLEGQIFHLNQLISNDTLKLSNVSVKVLELNKTVLSDTNGQFVLNLDKGIFSILVTKPGFQPLTIKNYVSDPDQFSGTTIYLENGTEQQTFVIPIGGTKQ
jgi:hypothetical protein